MSEQAIFRCMRGGHCPKSAVISLGALGIFDLILYCVEICVPMEFKLFALKELQIFHSGSGFLHFRTDYPIPLQTTISLKK